MLGSAAGRCVAAHTRLLRGCGFLHTRARSAPHTAYRAATLALTGAYLAQECVYAYRERADMEELARVMFLLLCHVTSIVKQLVFACDATRVDALLAALDAPQFAPRGVRAHRLLAECARGAARFVHAYSGTAVLTCTLWAVFPVLQHARGEPVQFPFWVSFRYECSARFWAVLLYSYYVTTLVGIANTTMDAFIATVLLQCKTQLAILRMNFENLTERARALAVTGGPEDDAAGDAASGAVGGATGASTRYERALNQLLVECLAHYSHICQTTQMLQDIFGTAILVQFGIGGWILCMAAYKIVSLDVVSGEFASMTLFICCILTELFLYCYYGNEVAVESSLVAQAVYGMRWERTPPWFRRALLLVMERARRPLRPAAGLVIPLSLDTFIKIIKSSYTFYAVLRQTK